MNDTPINSYGFTYEYEGRGFAVDVPAWSLEEAKGRLAAMSTAAFFGELRLADQSADKSDASR